MAMSMEAIDDLLIDSNAEREITAFLNSNLASNMPPKDTYVRVLCPKRQRRPFANSNDPVQYDPIRSPENENDDSKNAVNN
ncbi:hypothetical protein ACLKA7_016752 [Drosophila subpalustris]